MAAYVMVGFDSAGELSEETHKPAPDGAAHDHRALIGLGGGGALLLLGALMAAPACRRRPAIPAGPALRADQPAGRRARQASSSSTS